MLIICLIVALLTLYVPTLDAGSCTSYPTQATCATNSLCAWFSTYCGCASAKPLDIVFVLDSSGSMSSANFKTEQNFTVSMINTGISNDSYVGVVQFATTAVDVYNFTKPQYPRSLITTAVSSLTHMSQSTYMKTAMSKAITILNSTSARSSAQKIILLMTDGVPSPSSQSPCDLKNTTDKLGIINVVIGIGSSWTASTIKCLVDNTATQIISVTNFSTAAFDAVRQYTDTFICPSTVDVIVTEVRPIGNTTGRGAFIELYNKGSTIYLSANPLNISGLVSASITNNTITTWTNGTYLVLYSNNSADAPDCTNCSCTDGNVTVSGRQCSTTKYIKCTGIASTGGCVFQTTYKGSSVSKTNWGLEIIDKSDGTNVANVSYKSTFPSIWDYYSYELQSNLIDSTDGANWAQSCYAQGTPGQGPLSSCVQDCTNTNCRSGGDTSAYCSTPTSCTCSTGYYQLNTICYKINAPQSCSTKLVKGDTDTEAYITWDTPADLSVAVTSSVTYYVQYGNRGAATYTGSTETNYLFATYTGAASTDLIPIVTTQYNGVKISTSNASCPISTLAPSPAPTNPPTFSIPLVPSCSAVAGSASIVVTWSSATVNPPLTPSSVSKYKVYISKDAGVTYETFYSSSLSYTSSDGLTGSFNDLQVKVSAVVYDSSDVEETSRMEYSAVLCSKSTASPTKPPSPVPTSVPTPAPTNRPTLAPTNVPTYSPRGITSCGISILQGGQSFIINYQNTTCSYSYDCPNMVVKIRIQSQPIDYDVPYSGYTFSLANSNFDSTNTYTLVYSYPQSAASGASSSSGTFLCTVTTIAPTTEPTPAPTSRPTLSPSSQPTSSPTPYPTNFPTPSPTYETVKISSCSYNILQGSNSFIISFTEPIFSSNGINTPVVADIRYKITWSSYQEILQGKTSGAPYTATINQPINYPADDVTITVWNSFVEALGGPTECNGTTLAPTLAPTTPAPTKSPTMEDPVLNIDYVGMQCSENDATGIPECTVRESNTEPYYAIVSRTPSNFPGTVTFKWKISFTEPRRLQAEQEVNKLGANSYDITGDLNGTSSVISNTASGKFGIVFRQESDSQNDEYDGSAQESFYLQITDCDVPELLHEKYYDCSIGLDTIVIYVTNTVGNEKNVENEADLPTWIWYPIAAGLVLLPLLAWWGYRQYQKRKYAQEMNTLKQKELQDVEGQDDFHNFGGMGDEVQFNPLATGGTQDITTGGEYIDQQLDEQKKDFTTATVDVDNQVYRQDFGPVQPNKH